MHWRGHSRGMRELAVYADVVAEVRDELLAAGGRRGRAPASTPDGSSSTRASASPRPPSTTGPSRAHLDVLVDLGFPVLFGASRKTYLGRLLAGPDGTPRPVAEREAATLATSVLAVAAGAWGVRVHDVRATADALAVWRATGAPRIQNPKNSPPEHVRVTPSPTAAAPPPTARAVPGPQPPDVGG